MSAGAGKMAHASDPLTGPLKDFRAASHDLSAFGALGSLLKATGQIREGMTQLSGIVASLGADPMGRITGVVHPEGSERYAYNDLGHLVNAFTADGPSPAAWEVQGTLVRRAGRTSYEYDGQGRLIRKMRRTLDGRRHVWSYTWDVHDQLTSVTPPEGARWTYTYDPLGRRISKEESGADGAPGRRYQFHWDGDRLAEETGPDGTATM